MRFKSWIITLFELVKFGNALFISDLFAVMVIAAIICRSCFHLRYKIKLDFFYISTYWLIRNWNNKLSKVVRNIVILFTFLFYVFWSYFTSKAVLKFLKTYVFCIYYYVPTEMYLLFDFQFLTFWISKLLLSQPSVSHKSSIALFKRT